MIRLLFLLNLLPLGFLHAQTDTILIDFGNTPSPLPWNNLDNPSSGQLSNLVTTSGIASPLSITITDAFNGINANGTTGPDPAVGMASTATGDSFFGNTVQFNGKTEPTAALRMSGLDTAFAYTISLFASRMGVNDNRQTRYLLEGLTQDSAFLDPSNNTSGTATLSAYPHPDGTMDLLVSPGPGNQNVNGFYYLGAARLIIPTDSTFMPHLDLIQPDGGEFWQAGKTARIQWQVNFMQTLYLDYSIDGGGSWIPIDTLNNGAKHLDWIIPSSPSNECLVRVRTGGLSDQSGSLFEISQDTSECHIVVIGSSTAAGTGASTPDSAWVNRYRAAVTGDDTRMKVTNLAKGGFTTWHLLPTGTTTPAGVNFQIDTTRNLTAALALKPSMIIVNLPSNDAANGFDVADQLANFHLLDSVTGLSDVQLFVCTTQPRNFSDPQRRQVQIDLKDSIMAIYQDHAIDFWNGLADMNGWILPEFNSGDGVHLNDLGHALLASRVFMHQLDTICFPPITTRLDNEDAFDWHLSWSPNPFSYSVTLDMDLPDHADIKIDLFDLLGRQLFTRSEYQVRPGKHTLGCTPQLSGGGPYTSIYARVILNMNGHVYVRTSLLMHHE